MNHQQAESKQHILIVCIVDNTNDDSFHNNDDFRRLTCDILDTNFFFSFIRELIQASCDMSTYHLLVLNAFIVENPFHIVFESLTPLLILTMRITLRIHEYLFAHKKRTGAQSDSLCQTILLCSLPVC